MTTEWSAQQTEIFKWFKAGKGNLIVRARAGTGKTTTILEGISHAPEEKILLAAFNKRIADELALKLNNYRAEAKTLHSIGFRLVLSNWRGVGTDFDRGEKLARKAIEAKLKHTAPDAMVRLVAQLASKGKSCCPFPRIGDLAELAYQFNHVPDRRWESEGWTVEVIEKYAADAMALACERNGVDYDDMIFLPIRMKWMRGTYDLVVIDEAQDMNLTQLVLAQGVCNPNGRIAVVGDDRQAIYAFRGADANSIDRLKSELKAAELPLTTTYRCPKSIVAQAAQLVPDYQAAPSAPDGIVSTFPFAQLAAQAEVGDFVLSRKNAPLVKVCLTLLKAGKRAKIEGREIGKGLVALVRRFKARSIPDFVEKLERWEDDEVERAEASKKRSAEARIEFIHDQADALHHLSEGLSAIGELESRITALFDDVGNGNGNGSYIVCSSVHKAKGLESDRVFVLADTLYPGGKKTIEEMNIHYVAMTRAKHELTWIAGVE